MDIHKIVTEIKERLDIVDIISEYIGLKQRGRNFVALCPFHGEKTPSFTVSREKQIFYCFGCNVGGDIIKFLTLYENLSYIEAIKKLARKANIEVDVESFYSIPYEDNEKIVIKKINYETMEIYKKYLFSSEGKNALALLKERGFKEEVIKEFDLGYAPDSESALYQILSKKYDDKILLKSQVVSSVHGNIFDTFRNRIIIPIKSLSGEIIAFGARAINDEDQPKYLNSTETPVFSKRKTLFGLYNSISSIRKLKKAIIVEGYMDLIMMHQYRFGITVSPLGTSLTYEQAKLLKNYVEEVIIMFDSDWAGINAAIKASDLFIESGVYPKIAIMPQRVDPDEFLVKNGSDEMLKIINNAVDIISFKISLIKSKKTSFNPDEKFKIIEFIAPTLLKQNNEIIRFEWIKRISEEFKIPEEAIKSYLNKNIKKAKQHIDVSNSSDENVNIENNFIDILIARPDYVEKVMDITSDYFIQTSSKELFNFIRDNYRDPDFLNKIIEGFPNYNAVIMKSLIKSEENSEVFELSNFLNTVFYLKKNYYEREWRALKSKIPNLTEEEYRRFIELSEKLKNLNF